LSRLDRESEVEGQGFSDQCGSTGVQLFCEQGAQGGNSHQPPLSNMGARRRFPLFRIEPAWSTLVCTHVASRGRKSQQVIIIIAACECANEQLRLSSASALIISQSAPHAWN